MRGSGGFVEANTCAVGPSPGVVARAWLLLLVRVLSCEPHLPSDFYPSFFSFVGYLVIPWPRKTQRFVGKLVFFSKGYRRVTTFSWFEVIRAWTRWPLPILLFSHFMPNNPHSFALFYVRRVVRGRAGAFGLFVFLSDFFAHPEMKRYILPWWCFCECSGNLGVVREGRGGLRRCWWAGWVMQTLPLPLKVQAGAAL